MSEGKLEDLEILYAEIADLSDSNSESEFDQNPQANESVEFDFTEQSSYDSKLKRSSLKIDELLNEFDEYAPENVWEESAGVPDLTELVVPAPLEVPRVTDVTPSTATVHDVHDASTLPVTTHSVDPVNLIIEAPLEIPKPQPQSLHLHFGDCDSQHLGSYNLADLVVPAPLELPKQRAYDLTELVVPAPLELPKQRAYDVAELIVCAPLELPRRHVMEPPVQEPVQKAAQEPVQEPVQKAAQKAVQKTVDSPVGKSTDTPVDVPVEKTVDITANKPVEVRPPSLDDPNAVYLFMSMASGVRGSMKRFNMATTILKSYGIEYVPIEVTLDPRAKRLWKYLGANKNKVLPAIFRDGELKCDYNELVEANEVEDVEETIFDDV